MLASLYFGIILFIIVFSLVNFKFLSLLVFLECLNVLMLMYLLLANIVFVSTLFIIFMVVATVEVTVSLVVLTRVWGFDSIAF